MPDISTIRHERERQFAAAFFDHDQWEHESHRFALPDGTTYLPDFYDGKRDVHIEVVGSHQAYYANKGKYEIFVKEYPDIRLEFRNEEGSEMHPRRGQLFEGWKQSEAPQKDIFTRLLDHYGSHSNVARAIGIDPRHYRYMRNENKISAGMEHLVRMIDSGVDPASVTETELTQEIFDQLRDRYGSHSQVAREIGIDPRHYRIVRNDGKASAGLVKLIQMIAKTDNQEEQTCDIGA